jgi:hypothetical protein
VRQHLTLVAVALAALTAIAVAANSGAAAPSVLAAYFPLAPGTVWLYRSNVGAEVARRVGQVATVGGQACRYIETIVNGNISQAECYRVTNEGVYVVQRASPQGSVLLTPPQRLLAAPVAVGQKWEWSGTIGDRTLTFAYQWARQESTVTPAGTFSAMQLYFIGRPAPNAEIQSWRWFARGIGMIKEDTLFVQGGQQQRGYLELVRVTAGK